MSSSILASNGMVLATAMAAGTVILLAFRLQKLSATTAGTAQFAVVNHPRPCISSDGKKRGKKNKKVHFAEDVMEPSGNGEEFRRLQCKILRENRSFSSKSKDEGGQKKLSVNHQGIPANRMALYSGILRDRCVHRNGYSC